MKLPQEGKPRKIRAIKVHQWLSEWDKVQFNPKQHRAKPQSHFYLFSLSAAELRALSGIERRVTNERLKHKEDLGIQRRHDPSRSDEIRQFVEFGYPWSELSKSKRDSGEFDDLRKPGWLPTAVVVNILGENDKRRGFQVNKAELINVNDEDDGSALISLPAASAGPKWIPSDLPPIEVIDGQHRLWAFEDGGPDGKFEIPVVAFVGLDVSWQAYQFWTINIKPKRINPSLAFDLYPLLRTEDWLDKFEGHPIYRETRAQELVQHLWSHESSPWYQRINMLGESGNPGMVSQASWIRSLMATFVRSFENPRIGGLFGAPPSSKGEVLPWSRTQQAAFLILFGTSLREAIKKTRSPWSKYIRDAEPQESLQGTDPAFVSAQSFLTSDVGIRGLLFVANDLCFLRSTELSLSSWNIDRPTEPDHQSISNAIDSLAKTETGKFLKLLSTHLADFDWRSSAARGLLPQEVTVKKTLRGSGGYREMRRLLLDHLSKFTDDVGTAAKSALKILKLS